MKTDKVKKLPPVERFLYWIRERHAIYLRRQAGEPKPWTDDEVLQNWFFCNVYRENDKVTVWFREQVREPLRDDPKVLFATICFRWFNWIPTGEILLNERLLWGWDTHRAIRRLRGRSKIFTGAYIIRSPGGVTKLSAITSQIGEVWKDRERLIKWFDHRPTLEAAVKRLSAYYGMGGFMAYEVATDLCHTYLLEGAEDRMTWCNPGPGCIRGLRRLAGLPLPISNCKTPPRLKDWLDRMLALLGVIRLRLNDLPPFEMRDVEHSLCEYDKYCRALEGDGRLKRKYNGVNP